MASPAQPPVSGEGANRAAPEAPAGEPPPEADGRGEAEVHAELRARREEIVRMEERALRQMESVETQLRELERRRTSLDDRERNLDNQAEEMRQIKRRHRRELEKIAGLSAAQARHVLLKEVEDEARQQAGLTLQRIEEETRLEAERRARGILAVAMQRLAATQAGQTTTRLVQLPNDEMKGRIIGREGRNIRALENLTGVDFIIDETPCAVLLASFDGVRREIARLTLEKLIEDGRIHPARCEEAYEQAKGEMEDRIVEEAERALLEARITGVHPELVRLLGRLKFRTSYGQNVLDHLVECSHLAGLMAAELGASPEVARRGALLHDIGKAVSHDVEGTHAIVGARLARRYEEPEAVAHAIESHHNEVEPRTVEAVIVQAADALSGARPGARGESLEQYVSRLRDLEEIAQRHAGVEKVYAMQAGREIRVMVDPGEIDDESAALISHEIATAVEREMDYPGRIKITVIRESRATTYAK
ncbi:MAG TPA: ribonuclease Y [Solirubrobacterales bacterium]|nr:ribonuclease Y [Solirubrobacterales bacterium]